MRLTYSNVTATIALVAAVGGGGTAVAAGLARNSVGTAQIRNGSVQRGDLSRSARPATRARIAQVAEETVTSSEVLAALSGAVKGAPGPAGEQGPAGERGATGSPGVADVTIRQATGTPVADGFASAVARCEADERVLGGGGRFDADGSARGTLTMSAPDGDAWSVELNATGPGAAHAYAVCAKVG